MKIWQIKFCWWEDPNPDLGTTPKTHFIKKNVADYIKY